MYQLELPTDGVWKFIRVAGVYRWCDGMRNHSNMIGTNEIADAAGLIFAFKDHKMAYMESSYSMTLNIGADQQTYDDLETMFVAIGYKWN